MFSAERLAAQARGTALPRLRPVRPRLLLRGWGRGEGGARLLAPKHGRPGSVPHPLLLRPTDIAGVRHSTASPILLLVT